MPPADPYQDLSAYYGDLHNHCDLSYGHGSFDEAIANARLQLDFASVTLHALWPDMPTDDPRLDYLTAYHQYGFDKARENWPGYLRQVEELHQDGRFVLFPSYEWHSCAFGDHCITYQDGRDRPLLDAPDLPALRRKLAAQDPSPLLIPHHIGYHQGYRGVNWEAFSEALSPLAEIVSFHGASESSAGPYPYLHSMGPRHGKSCAQQGWERGHRFGVIGSTDGHSAFPGSYGRGRMGLWADALTREALWEALQNRRTWALTGDRIALRFSLNGRPMGALCPPTPRRRIAVDVRGGDALDIIEVLHNNRVIHRECPLAPQDTSGPCWVHLELGWGERPEPTDWEVRVDVLGGELLAVEPRFRGFIGQGIPEDGVFAYTRWEHSDPNRVHFQTRTRPNPTPRTPAMEGMAFQIRGREDVRLRAIINGNTWEHPLSELLQGNRTHYLGGFVSPAVCFRQAAPESACTRAFTIEHSHISTRRDWYTLRVRQRNNQWAWSSPIWVAG